ncbi:hypothetical protein JNUCC42_04375 [Brevibacterium sp. JNUCC-42]|nr:hypothetical protein JNUCC42_04375 [Brevibacterium sp. JNUCC-42]
MFEEIDPRNIEVGKKYQFEEKHHIAAIVTILEDESEDDWVGYKLRVDEIIFGGKKVGDEFSCGYDKEYGCDYREWKFKAVGSITDYVINRTGMGIFEPDKDGHLDINRDINLRNLLLQKREHEAVQRRGN